MMNKKVIILVLMLIVLFSCNKDNEFDYSLIQTGDVTNIDSTGATFHARISDLSNSNILNYGFVWSIESNPEIQNSEKYLISGEPSVGTISEKISTTLKDNVTYYVRAFMQNDNYITYGKEVTFTSLGSSAPTISDFFPNTGNINDTLYIVGRNFSYITDNNKVYIDNFQSNVIYSVQDTLIVIIPNKLNIQSSTISVSIFGNETKSTEKFNLIPPILNDFENKAGTFGSQITISGNNFLSNPSSLKVNFDAYKAKINKISNTSLTVIVPDSLNVRRCNIEVLMNNLRATSIDSFKLESLVLNDFSPTSILTGEKIILTGNNFSPIPENNIIQIGGIPAKVVNASLNELEVVVPLQDKGIYPERNVSIAVDVIGDKKNFDETLLINDKWFRLSDAPISANGSGYSSEYTLANCFVSNNKAFIGLNNKSEFWGYDPIQDKWEKLSDFPGTPRWYGTGFVIDDNIYFGTGSGNGEDLKDWWKYDISLNSWTQKSNFSGEKRTGAVAFQVGNSGYLGTGFLWNVSYYDHGYTDFWKYSSTNDSWSLVTNYPMFENFGMWWGIALANNTEAYMGLGNVTISGDYEKWMYRYEPSSNSWYRIANYPYADVNNAAIGFELGGDIYIKTSYSDDFYYYNSLLDSWSKIQTGILYDFDMGIAFSIGSKAYVGLGRKNQMWEYDPNRQ